MSYILEALKKSERERDTETIPTISAYDITPTEQSKRALYLLGGLVAFLTLALVSVIYWKVSHPAEGVSSTATPHLTPPILTAPTLTAPILTIPTLTPPALTNPAVPVPRISAPITTTPLSAIPRVPENKTTPNASPFSQTIRPAVESLFDMPAQFQRQIPALNYASHWYAKEPRSRNVIINNRSLKEGDWINASIQIVEISRHQVTLTSQQQAFSLPALESWEP